MQILRLGLVPGGGTRSVTFEAHQNLTSDFAHVYVICISSGWWSTSASSCTQKPEVQLPHSSLLQSIPLGPKTLTQQKVDMDFWVCPGLPVSRTLTGDPLGLEGWESGAPVPAWMLDWTGSWGVRRPGRSLELFVMFHSWMNHAVAGRSLAAPQRHTQSPIMFILFIYISHISLKSMWMAG